MDTICVLLFQISSHVKAIDAIYQGTDFMGIRNISFMVKRIRVRVVLILSLHFGFGPFFHLNSSSSSCVDKHHQWREGQVQSIPLSQHRGGEVPGAELRAKPWRLLLGICFHWQRLWWRRVGFGLGRSPLRYQKTSVSSVNSKCKKKNLSLFLKQDMNAFITNKRWCF